MHVTTTGLKCGFPLYLSHPVVRTSGHQIAFFTGGITGIIYGHRREFLVCILLAVAKVSLILATFKPI